MWKLGGKRLVSTFKRVLDVVYEASEYGVFSFDNNKLTIQCINYNNVCFITYTAHVTPVKPMSLVYFFQLSELNLFLKTIKVSDNSIITIRFQEPTDDEVKINDRKKGVGLKSLLSLYSYAQNHDLDLTLDPIDHLRMQPLVEQTSVPGNNCANEGELFFEVDGDSYKLASNLKITMYEIGDLCSEPIAMYKINITEFQNQVLDLLTIGNKITFSLSSSEWTWQSASESGELVYMNRPTSDFITMSPPAHDFTQTIVAKYLKHVTAIPSQWIEVAFYPQAIMFTGKTKGYSLLHVLVSSNSSGFRPVDKNTQQPNHSK